MIGSRRLLLAVAAVLLAACSQAGSSGVRAAADRGSGGGLVVSTDRGAVLGALAGQVRRFLGIPYAAPPVGALRWRPPQDHAAWSGVRDATTFGSPCPQIAGQGNPGSTDEDCLFLNVYTPALARGGGRLPVMLWIHGGALETGAGSLYDPAQLVAQGVVVVTINYRLGALGFLAGAALSTGASGNYGTMDQIAALRWTQRNIREFGGDPGNVTIFGQSAGGLSVLTLLVSPLARGLFAKAIEESGAYSVASLQLVEATQAQVDAGGVAFAAAVGCGDGSAACLRGLPVATLLAHQATNGYAPHIDGRVLTRSIGPALDSGAFDRVPLIMGSNHDEWRLFVAQAEAASGRPVPADGYDAALATTLPGPAAGRLATANYPLAAYGGNASIALGAAGTDVFLACKTSTAVRSASRFVPTYQYEFADEQAPPVMPGISFPMGASHAAELQYLFANFGLSPLSPAQQTLSATMVEYWTRFAKTGDPNAGSAPAWPRYTSASDRFLSLAPPAPTVATGFAAEHKCSLWGQ
jgi:para-nitrobenzyl esterase